MRRRDVLALSASGVVAACTRAAAASDVEFWAIGTEGEYAPPLVSRFVRESGLHVATQAIPWTAAHQKLLTAFVGNSLPDISMIRNSWLPELALLDAFAPAPTDSPLLSDVFPAALSSVMHKGVAIAVPWAVDAWVQFYRRDLLAAAGYPGPATDWSEWVRMARFLKRRQGDNFVTLHLIDWPEPLFAFAAQQPEPLLRDHNTRGNFRSPGFRDALGRYKQVFDEHWSPVVQGAQFGDSLIALRRGQILILPSAGTTIGDLRRRASWFAPDLWAIEATPGTASTPRSMASGISLAVNRKARNPAGAWRLAEFLCGASATLELYREIGDLPARRSVWNAPVVANGVGTSAFARHVEGAVAPPAVPEWERIVSEVQLIAERMVRGEFGVDRATIEMDDRVDAILAKRRDLLSRGRPV